MLGFVPMHLRKMLLKHGGMVPTPSGSRGLRRGGHHGQGEFLKTAGTKNYAGIKYSLRRNSTGGGLKQQLNHYTSLKMTMMAFFRRLSPALPLAFILIVVIVAVHRLLPPPSSSSLSLSRALFDCCVNGAVIVVIVFVVLIVLIVVIVLTVSSSSPSPSLLQLMYHLIVVLPPS